MRRRCGFLITDSVRDVQRLRLLTRWLIIGGSLAALIAVILYLLPDQTSMNLLSSLRVFNYPEGPGVLRYILDDPTLPQRATGTAIDPNALGGLLIMMLTLAVPQLFTRRPVLPRGWLIIGLALMGLALLLSFSRGSFLGAAIALGALGVVRYRKLLVIMAVALALVLILPQTQGYRPGKQRHEEFHRITAAWFGRSALHPATSAGLAELAKATESKDSNRSDVASGAPDKKPGFYGEAGPEHLCRFFAQRSDTATAIMW